MGKFKNGEEVAMFDGHRYIEGKMYYVKCIEDNKEYGFVADTPYEALKKMIYTLNIKEICKVKINKTKSGKHLWFEHNNKTYAVRNNRKEK